MISNPAKDQLDPGQGFTQNELGWANRNTCADYLYRAKSLGLSQPFKRRPHLLCSHFLRLCLALPIRHRVQTGTKYRSQQFGNDIKSTGSYANTSISVDNPQYQKGPKYKNRACYAETYALSVILFKILLQRMKVPNHRETHLETLHGIIKLKSKFTM